MAATEFIFGLAPALLKADVLVKRRELELAAAIREREEQQRTCARMRAVVVGAEDARSARAAALRQLEDNGATESQLRSALQRSACAEALLALRRSELAQAERSAVWGHERVSIARGALNDAIRCREPLLRMQTTQRDEWRRAERVREDKRLEELPTNTLNQTTLRQSGG